MRDKLEALMGRYTVKDIKNVTPLEFEAHIKGLIGSVDAEVEGYKDASKQRDLSVKFHWGHDHDFGSFKVEGIANGRHIQLLCDYLALFDLKLDFLRNKTVLDVGVWTGGTSLLLAALGCVVVALEEVKKYAQALQYLAYAFGIDGRLITLDLSLYETSFQDKFDLVYCSGVLYHVTDPVVAARIMFNALKPGGFLLLETAFLGAKRPLFSFEACQPRSGPKLGRTGWNWFKPSPSALKNLLGVVGFKNIRVKEKGNRLFAIAKKEKQVDMVRAGLSKDLR